jgi:zinc/manganese transport system substrate-binding protein
LIAAELEVIAPGGGWFERADAYVEELAATNDEVVEILSVVPVESRKMVTNHDALGYFANLYDFEIVGLVIPSGSTLADPSSGELAELIEVINTEGIEVIFSDSTAPSDLADAVASDAGDIAIVELYTGSVGEPESGADTLIGMLTSNAQSVADALS